MLAATLAVLAFAHGNAIYTMSADGSGVHRLTTGGEPAYSPSGDMLAFTRTRGEERAEIWVSAPDGSGARRLVGAGRGYDYVSSPAWSPDGTMIAFTHFTLSERVGLVSRIEVVDREGRARRTVVGIKPRALEAVLDPAWTPDGRRLVYTRTRATPDMYRFELRSVVVDGGADALFLRDAASAAFSPDGTRIAFSDSSTDNGRTCGSDECYPNGELAVAGADGSGRRILFKSESDEGTPSWSPDGARIAFTSGRNIPTEEGGAEVYTIAPDGSCLTWLTNGDRGSGLPAWTPGSGTSAAGCGTDRPPLQELRVPARVRGSWWLGRSFRAAMLSSVDSSAFYYGDCSAFDPRACPPPFSLYQQDMCHGGPAQRGFVQSLGKPRRVRGGALAATRDRGDSLSLVVLTGRTAITVDVEIRITPKRRRELFDQIVAGLRRVGSARRAKLPPPRVDRSLRRFLNADVSPC